MRLVDLEIGIDEEEHPARPCLVEHRLRNLVQPFEGLRGLDHQLHRQAAGARQGWKLERGDIRSGDAPPFFLQLGLQFGRAALALVPWLEQDAADPLVDDRYARDLEHLVVFRQLA